MRLLPIGTFLLAAATGCATSAPSPDPTPATSTRPVAGAVIPTTPTATGSAAGRRAGAAAGYAAGAQGFAVDAEATIEQAAFDTVPARSETRTTTAHVTYRLDEADTSAGRQTLAGSVEFFTVVARGVDGRQQAASLLTTPFEFRGVLESAGPSLVLEAVAGADAGGCASVAPTVLAMARDVLVALPATVAVGDSWRETVESTECRGGVAVTSRSEHLYSAAGTGEQGGVSEALRLERVTRVTITGLGVQRGDTIRVLGSGEGRAELWVDLAGGRMLGGSSETRAQLEVRAGLREPQRFVQVNRRRVQPR